MLERIKKVRQFHVRNGARNFLFCFTFVAFHFELRGKLNVARHCWPDVKSANAPKYSERPPIAHLVVNAPFRDANATKKALEPTLGTTALDVDCGG